MVGSNHPTIYRLVEHIQLEQSLMETKKARLDAGETHPLYSKVVYRAINQRLQTVIADYANRDLQQFLRSCSYNFNFYRVRLSDDEVQHPLFEPDE